VQIDINESYTIQKIINDKIEKYKSNRLHRYVDAMSIINDILIRTNQFDGKLKL